MLVPFNLNEILVFKLKLVLAPSKWLTTEHIGSGNISSPKAVTAEHAVNFDEKIYSLKSSNYKKLRTLAST